MCSPESVSGTDESAVQPQLDDQKNQERRCLLRIVDFGMHLTQVGQAWQRRETGMRVPFAKIVETLWLVPIDQVKAPHELAVLYRITNKRRGRAAALHRQIPDQEFAIGNLFGSQNSADFVAACGAQLALELAHASRAEQNFDQAATCNSATTDSDAALSRSGCTSNGC